MTSMRSVTPGRLGGGRLRVGVPTVARCARAAGRPPCAPASCGGRATRERGALVVEPERLGVDDDAAVRGRELADDGAHGGHQHLAPRPPSTTNTSPPPARKTSRDGAQRRARRGRDRQPR